MRLGLALAAVAAATVVAFAHAASAVTHQATIGNYYYEDDQQRDETKIVVHAGDQITFTVREQAVPGHTVDVDALNIHSPNLNIGQTFTTPPLREGNFYLYCRPHEDRGHHTRLIVLAAATQAPSHAPQRTATPPHIVRTPTHTPAPAASPAPTPATSLTPVGVGTAPPGALGRPVPTNPNSLNALTGRTVSHGVPWTRSLWWLLVAAVPIIAAAGVALQRARVAEYQPKVEHLRRARGNAPAKEKPARKRKP